MFYTISLIFFLLFLFLIRVISKQKKRIRKLESVISGGELLSKTTQLRVIQLLSAVRNQSYAWMPKASKKHDYGMGDFERLTSPALNVKLDEYLTNLIAEIPIEGPMMGYVKPAPDYEKIATRNYVNLNILGYAKIIPCLTKEEAMELEAFFHSKSVDAKAAQILTKLG